MQLLHKKSYCVYRSLIDWYKYKKSDVWGLGHYNYSDKIIERITSVVATIYDGGDLHNILLRLIYIYENNYQAYYVALFKSVISMKDSRITIYME